MTLYFTFIKQSSQHTVSQRTIVRRKKRGKEKEKPFSVLFFKTKFLLHAKKIRYLSIQKHPKVGGNRMATNSAS